MHGFRQFILSEAQINNDLAILCKNIMKDPAGNRFLWDAVIELMSPINKTKANIITRALEINDEPILKNLLESGQDGFMNIDGGRNYRKYVRAGKRPMLTLSTGLLIAATSAMYPTIEFSKEICEQAARNQIGIGEIIGRNDIEENMLDMSTLRTYEVTLLRPYRRAPENDPEVIQMINDLIQEHGIRRLDFWRNYRKYRFYKDFEDSEKYEKFLRENSKYRNLGE